MLTDRKQGFFSTLSSDGSVVVSTFKLTMGHYLRTYLIGVDERKNSGRTWLKAIQGAVDVSDCWISWQSSAEQAATWLKYRRGGSCIIESIVSRVSKIVDWGWIGRSGLPLATGRPSSHSMETYGVSMGQVLKLDVAG